MAMILNGFRRFRTYLVNAEIMPPVLGLMSRLTRLPAEFVAEACSVSPDAEGFREGSAAACNTASAGSPDYFLSELLVSLSDCVLSFLSDVLPFVLSFLSGALVPVSAFLGEVLSAGALSFGVSADFVSAAFVAGAALAGSDDLAPAGDFPALVEPVTVTSLRTSSSVFGPMPGTFLRSSTDLNGPFLLR